MRRCARLLAAMLLSSSWVGAAAHAASAPEASS
ncbi:MAG: hypothetical protein RLZZ200_61, partial [Pseudomonadota bacterium]